MRKQIAKRKGVFKRNTLIFDGKIYWKSAFFKEPVANISWTNRNSVRKFFYEWCEGLAKEAFIPVLPADIHYSETDPYSMIVNVDYEFFPGVLVDAQTKGMQKEPNG